MLDEIDYIEQAKQETDKRRFLSDETLKRSFVRSIEIIGEAAKKLPDAFRQEHNEIPWQKIAGMWDKLIHDCQFCIEYNQGRRAAGAYKEAKNVKRKMKNRRQGGKNGSAQTFKKDITADESDNRGVAAKCRGKSPFKRHDMEQKKAQEKDVRDTA
jgi:hypothetical protein